MKINKKLLIIFVVAFVIRLINLNQSLWLDEATTARVAQQYNFIEILTKFSPFDFHPPLFYWLIKLWTSFFGYSEISLRMPSIIFSALTGYVVYLIGKLLANEKIGFWSAVFFLFNPLIVYYSQEARMYLMATFLLTKGLYTSINLINDFEEVQKSKFKVQNYSLKFKNLFLMNLFFILSLFTFYGSIFFIAALFIYLLIKKQYRLFIYSFIPYFLLFILLSPLIHQQWLNSKLALTNVTNWSLVLGKANLKNLILIPIKFLIGRIDFYPKWIYYLVAGGWTVFVISQIANLKSQIHNLNLKAVNLLIYLFIFPLILGFIISFFTPLLQYFRFIYLIPVLALILALSINVTIIRIIVTAGFSAFSLIYLLIPNFQREDWKKLANSLPKHETIYMIKPSSDPLAYYRPEVKIEELRNISNQLIKLPHKLIIIPYTTEIYGFDYKKIISDFTLTNEVGFRGVNYEIWVKL